jgi:HlyD family secretion protein
VAPDDGVVLSIKTKVPGTVVRGADTVVDLVADGSSLEVEVDVNPRDIAHVKSGRSADIKFDTLPYVRHGSLKGEVLRVSEDTFERTLNNTAGPVYRARLKLMGIDASGNGSTLRDTPAGFRLQPGMTLNADILAGRRPLSAVVFYPVAKALGNGLREP